jgi:hypothetical protein
MLHLFETLSPVAYVIDVAISGFAELQYCCYVGASIRCPLYPLSFAASRASLAVEVLWHLVGLSYSFMVMCLAMDFSCVCTIRTIPSLLLRFETCWLWPFVALF